MRLGDSGYAGRKDPVYSKEGNGLYSSSKKTRCVSVMRILATATDAPFLLIDRLTKLWIILCDFYDVNCSAFLR